MVTPQPQPRPRPRPRPRPAQKSTSNSAGSSEKADRNEELEREDSYFIRNQTRTAEQWTKLSQAYKEPSVMRQSSDDEEPSTQKKKRQPTKSGKGWQNNTNINRYLSQEVSSGGESDDDIQIVGESSKKSSMRKVSPGKRKRSKSRSLTPPPEVSAYALAHARNVVRQAFNEPGRQRSKSPMAGNDLSEGDITDPELRKIAEKAKQRLKEAKESDSVKGVVLIKVKWTPNLLNKGASPQLWAFKMNKDDSFRELFDNVAKLSSIPFRNLVVTYKGSRVYSSSSPKFMQMEGQEEELDAYDQQTYDYLQEQRRARSVSAFDSDVEEEHVAPVQSSVHSDDESEAGEKLTLTLRSSKTTKAVTLKVKLTTTCEVIVAAFIKQAGITANASRGRISVEGDKMEPSTAIGDADVEDGDVVDVVGLE